jgi:hypothetical protein
LEVAETDWLLVELVEPEELELVWRPDVSEPLFVGVNTTRTTAPATRMIATTATAASLGATPLLLDSCMCLSMLEVT